MVCGLFYLGYYVVLGVVGCWFGFTVVGLFVGVYLVITCCFAFAFRFG